MKIELMATLFFAILCLMNIVLTIHMARIRHLENEISKMKHKINELTNNKNTEEDTYKELVLKPVKPSNSGTIKML